MLAIMKRTALVLILSLGTIVARADEFDIVDYGIFRSTDPLAQRDEWGLVHQTPVVNATDFAPRISLALVLLLQLTRTITSPTCLRWLNANGVAPVGLLLRPC